MVTPNGKEIELYSEGFGVKARFKGGGQLPDELSGTWTNHSFAMNTINTYLDKMEDKKSKRYKPELNPEDYKK